MTGVLLLYRTVPRTGPWQHLAGFVAVGLVTAACIGLLGFSRAERRKALDLIQEAKDQGMGSADRDLFDILWREGDPGYYQQMVDLVLQKSEEGNKWAMQRMAKAYRYGIGVEKDLVEAAELMSKVAASNRSEEVRDIYFDLLLEVDDPARYEEMVGSVYRLAMDGSPDPEARYGLA